MNEFEELRYIDLFCGLGAFHTAFTRNSNKKKKYTCVYACDIDKDVQKIYYENYNIKPEGDINTININTIPEFDILCAGWPCQPFSIAGNKEGFNDKKKGNLFYKILDIIDVKKPKKIMLENVRNLETINNGETFKYIKNELEKKGYKVSYKVIDSKYYNSPQSRKRIYIICDKIKEYKFANVKNEIIPVSTIIDFTVEGSLELKDKYNFEECSNGMMIYKLINKNTGKGGRQGERVYGLNNCGATICATSGGVGSKTGLYEINGKYRTLTIKETLKMFGFSPNYKYNTLRSKNKMLYYLGNSIVVNVLERLIHDL